MVVYLSMESLVQFGERFGVVIGHVPEARKIAFPAAFHRVLQHTVLRWPECQLDLPGQGEGHD